jgi:hypothetical protein
MKPHILFSSHRPLRSAPAPQPPKSATDVPQIDVLKSARASLARLSSISRALAHKPPNTHTCAYSYINVYTYASIYIKDTTYVLSLQVQGIFFSQIRHIVHWRGFPSLISIKWRFSSAGCSIFTKVLLQSGNLGSAEV